MAAVATHYVSPERLEEIVQRRTPLLVIGATEDKLVRFKNPEYLSQTLQPIEFLVSMIPSRYLLEHLLII